MSDENIEDLVSVRPRSPADDALIYQTWLKGLYYGNDWFRLTQKETFFRSYRKVIDRILLISDCICVCLKDDPDVVLGYSVIDGDKLNWIFVKSSWRRKGIAKRYLITPDIKRVSHLTQIGKTLKPKEWVFDPF